MSLKLKTLLYAPLTLGFLVIFGVMVTVEDPDRRLDLATIILLSWAALESAVAFPILFHLQLKKSKGEANVSAVETEGESNAIDANVQSDESVVDADGPSSKPNSWKKYKFGKWERVILSLSVAGVGIMLVIWGEGQHGYWMTGEFEGTLEQAREMDGFFHESNSWFRYTRTPIGMAMRLVGLGIFGLGAGIMPKED
jgi:hypothetical protein